jgi:hypothetical protein
MKEITINFTHKKVIDWLKELEQESPLGPESPPKRCETQDIKSLSAWRQDSLSPLS